MGRIGVWVYGPTFRYADTPTPPIRRLDSYPLPFSRGIQPAIQFKCGTDKCHVGKRLREIT